MGKKYVVINYMENQFFYVERKSGKRKQITERLKYINILEYKMKFKREKREKYY